MLIFTAGRFVSKMKIRSKGGFWGRAGKILVVDVIAGNNPNVPPLGTGHVSTTGHVQLQSDDRGTETTEQRRGSFSGPPASTSSMTKG